MAVPIRNVFIVGPVGSGKRSVGNHLFGKIEFEQRKTFPADPEDIFCKRSISADGTVLYNVIIADVAPTGRSLLQNAKDWFESTSTALNLVLFTYNQVTFNSEDDQALSFFISNLQMELSEISALIITGCDKLNDKAKTKLVNREDISPSISKFMKKGIFTVGIPTSDAEQVISPEDLKVLQDLALECALQRTHVDIFEERGTRRLSSCCNVL